MYFTIESLADSNTIKIGKNQSPANLSLSYSVDDGETWTDLAISAGRDFTTINTGDKIMFKGVNDRFASAWNAYYRFYSSKNFNVYGNAMSLLFGDDFINNSEFKTGTTYNLCGLFYGTTTLIDASNLILPATICTEDCYNGTFRGCTNLTTAPQLPATQSARECYSSMFEGCINLEVAPEINLVNMSELSCKRMFCMDRNKKITTPKMTKSPILHCATGASGCYEEMFKGNGNLVEITCLATTYDNNSRSNWVTNISDTGIFYKYSHANWQFGTSDVPNNWTIADYEENNQSSQSIPGQYNLWDILYTDGNGNLSVSHDILDVSLGKTPIAICIAKTGFFGVNEKARWASLKWLNRNPAPNNGQTLGYTLCFGPNCNISEINDIVLTHINSSGDSLCEGKFDWSQPPTGSTYQLLPNIDDTNGDWNLSELGTINNYALTDINGKAKTAIYQSYVTVSNWQNTGVSDNTNSGNWPAVMAAYHYAPNGT